VTSPIPEPEDGSLPSPFAPFLDRQGFVLLDGGLGTALEAAGADLNDPLWSARVLMDGEGLLRQVHAAFLEAGADVIATCTYQASIPGFASQGVQAGEARSLMRSAVQVALRARDEYAYGVERLRPLVAASVGPYGAFLADGSEYTGRYALSDDQLLEFHRERWLLLADSGADIMACETIPSMREVRQLLSLLDETRDLWAWFSFSCRDARHLADGTPLREAVALVSEHPRAAAVGANCVAPESVPALIAEMRPVTDRPLMVYPNSGEHYDAASKTWERGRHGVDFAEAVLKWREAGALCVGGCCRTEPESIRRMRRALVGG
jgi:homocysteine S-methyltransferase